MVYSWPTLAMGRITCAATAAGSFAMVSSSVTVPSALSAPLAVPPEPPPQPESNAMKKVMTAR